MKHESTSFNEMYRHSTAAKARDVSMYNADLFFAHALKQSALPFIIAFILFPRGRDPFGQHQKSFLVLTKRIAASGDENALV